MRKAIAVKFHDQIHDWRGTDGAQNQGAVLVWRNETIHSSTCPTVYRMYIEQDSCRKESGELHPIPPSSRPFERVHIDHMEPLVKSTMGNVYILVADDSFTKFVRLWAVKNTGTRSIVRSLEDLLLDYGLPEHIVSDRGTGFTSQVFNEFCRVRGIIHTLNSTRHPLANGEVEQPVDLVK